MIENVERVPLAWLLLEIDGVPMSNETNKRGQADGHYEFRVWGRHRKARKALKKMASEVIEERYEDCYLLVDDQTFNAKVRDDTLKVKQLIAQKKGFEQWASGRHRTVDSTPSPFDAIFEELRLDRPQRGKRYNLPEEVRKLDPDSGVRAVFVTKNRRRYRVGESRAEVTDIELHDTDQVLRTLSIEGDNLDELVKLRKELGLKDEPNVAVHRLIDAETG